MVLLPIDHILPQLKETLRDHVNAVLIAAPGAGKTTRVPLALLNEPWLAGRRILMLEPRRLAARTAAKFMAAQLGESVGETVGYRVRMETKVGPKTRIEVITEGVLTRMLQADPALEGVGAVLFDEFHERSLHADLGLALALQSQALLREDLRLLVMSATLEAEPVAALLGGAPVLASEGRAYPVETRYADRRIEGRIDSAVASAVMEALANDEGDLLVFLPGAGEIRAVEARLAAQVPTRYRQVRIAPLYGAMPQEAQDRAIAPCEPGERKVVLATSIAETSLTVEGVRVVIDSGLSRVPRFSPRTGMTRLETTAVSRASADQRRGRAGRLGPGVCYRLWTEQDERNLPARSIPEILEADLAPLALELAEWGVTEPGELMWLDPPPAAAYEQARELLSQLGALGPKGELSPHGRQLAELGLHPRLAHMIVAASRHGLGATACELAALLAERDLFRGNGTRDADLRLRLEALRRASGDAPAGVAVDAAALRRIRAESAQWKRAAGVPPDEPVDSDACGLLLALAYPDRIGQRRSDGRYLLSNGRGAAYPAAQATAGTPYIVAAELDDTGTDSRIDLSSPVTVAELERFAAELITDEAIVEWDADAQAVRARQRKRLGALILKESPLVNPDPSQCLAALMQGISRHGVGMLPWNKASRQLQQRILFMNRHTTDWPDVSDDALAASPTEWLGPHAYGMRSKADLQRLGMTSVLESLLSWEQRRELDEQAPTHITVPSGSRIAVDYGDPDAPVLAVRLQEMFGQQDTHRIARGKVPIVMHLLSPAQRPVQVTQDLANFWRTTYFEVKKDLKGRYPKHYWPDDPLCAMPTHRTRPRP